MNEAELRRRLSEGYGRSRKAKRWQDRDRQARCTAWAALLRHELAKLERRGEEMDPVLLEWAKGTSL